MMIMIEEDVEDVEECAILIANLLEIEIDGADAVWQKGNVAEDCIGINSLIDVRSVTFAR